MRRMARYSTRSGSDLVTRGIYQVATAARNDPINFHSGTSAIRKPNKVQSVSVSISRMYEKSLGAFEPTA